MTVPNQTHNHALRCWKPVPTSDARVLGIA